MEISTTTGFNLGDPCLEMVAPNSKSCPRAMERGLGEEGRGGGGRGGEVAFLYTVPHLPTSSFLLHIPCCFGCFNLTCRSL